MHSPLLAFDSWGWNFREVLPSDGLKWGHPTLMMNMTKNPLELQRKKSEKKDKWGQNFNA